MSGTVQGVGFRPFVHRLARRSGLTGAVGNDGRGVWCEVQGPAAALDDFTDCLRRQAPPLARVRGIKTEVVAVVADEDGFVIAADPRAAAGDGAGAGLPMTPASIPPDAAVCEACSAEISDPADRRFGYAFTCCTDCGPPLHRGALPAPMTGLAPPWPTSPCAGGAGAEYDRAGDRRHHAQATCCPDCGPALELRGGGRPIAGDPDGGAGSLIADRRGSHRVPLGPGNPLAAAASLIAGSGIVAVKGLGGYQLVCRADDDTAVARLRAAKNRYEKPFALLVASLGEAEALVELDDLSRRALTGPERPIVLAERRPGAGVCEAVAPGSRLLGVMLPAAPLHQLLASAAPVPLVCTSGNRSDEPIAIDDADAAVRLGVIADAFLTHDRRIERRADDSVGQAAAGRFQLLRRARGFVPRPVRLGRGGPTVLGVGAELKSTVCLGLGDEAHLSVHLGRPGGAPRLGGL